MRVSLQKKTRLFVWEIVFICALSASIAFSLFYVCKRTAFIPPGGTGLAAGGQETADKRF